MVPGSQHPDGPNGAARICPHCKSTILASSVRCPVCQHYLSFDATPDDEPETVTALKVDGMITHPDNGETWEYQVVIAIHDDQGNEITRQLVGVGALGRGEKRNFQLAVEIIPTPHLRRQV